MGVGQPMWRVISAAVLAAACGAGDDGAAGDTTAPGRDCVAVAASAINGFDLAGIRADDGLDAAERATVARELAAARREHPELEEQAECAAALQIGDELERLVDGHRLAILRALGSATFTSVPPPSKAPDDPD